MCVLCGVTQTPVCTVTGSCGINIQQLASLALIIGGSTATIARLWIIQTYHRAYSFVGRIFNHEKN